MPKAALLLSDHDTYLVVATALECAGFDCERFSSIDSLMRTLRQATVELVVMEGDGRTEEYRDVLRLRQGWLESAFAVITIGGSDAAASIRSLQAGADDVLMRPVRGPELQARVEAALRRRRGIATRTSGLGPSACSVDLEGSALVSSRNRVDLTPRELALAQLLFEHSGQLVSRAQISQEVLGRPEDPTRRTLEQHVHQLRKKLRRCVGDELVLYGVYGSGYRLDTKRADAQG
ncbi:response regulator transcription factor [Paucibacter sp. PLA-PC-4]|uniref:response regulator transcription factor n=1 Tax=Paucibacter sp. PLA-PC-4 TaxID=2993655 RepID=UPI00224B0753|nr:response regulator transcription factor [Paucibacter sp. PLA-PC-4]